MTSRILPEFGYVAPETLEEATSALVEFGQNVAILAGGTDLLSQMKVGERTTKVVVDLNRVSGLDYISFDDGVLKIGALATIRQLERSKTVQSKFPILSEAARKHSFVQIRNMATVVGNLCNASPCADMAPPLLVLIAAVKLISTEGERIVPLDQFFVAPQQTVMKPDEIMVEVQIKEPQPGTEASFFKIGRVQTDLSKVNGAVKIVIDRDGTCRDAAIALGSVAPTPIRIPSAEKELIGAKIHEDVIDKVSSIVAADISPITDVRSTEQYRRMVSKVLVRRSLLRIWRGRLRS